ncbi:CHAD domain-containing protein [Phormidesmis priestleyi]
MKTTLENPMQKSAKRETLEDFAHQAIAKHFKKFVKPEADVLQDKDPEYLHQMRVGIRRLRTAIQVFGFAIQLPQEASNRRLAKVAHTLGAVRDLDVLTAELEAQQQADLPKAEQAELATLLKKLHKQRKQDFDQLKQTLKSSKYQDLKDAFEQWLEKPEYAAIAQLPILEVLPDLLLPLISETLLHPAWLVGATFENGKDTISPVEPETIGQFLKQNSLTLHDLRKQMKRVRYQTELFVDFYDDRYAAQVDEFKTIQEVLGQIQDSAVLQDYVETQLQVSLSETCPTVAKHLDRNVAQACKHWQTLQSHYLDAAFRDSLRQLCSSPQKAAEESVDRSKSPA